MKTWLLLPLLLLGQVPPEPIQFEPSGLDSETKAWLVGRPKVLSDGVELFTWSPGGGSMVFVKRTVPDRTFLKGSSAVELESRLQVFSYRSNGNARLLGDLPAGASVQTIAWLSDSRTAAINVQLQALDQNRQLTEAGAAVYLADVVSGKLVAGIQSPSVFPISTEPAPNRPLAVSWTADLFGVVFEPGGATRKIPSPMPGAKNWTINWLGDSVLLVRVAGEARRGWSEFVYSVDTGQFRPAQGSDFEEVQNASLAAENRPPSELFVEPKGGLRPSIRPQTWNLSASQPGRIPSVELVHAAQFAALSEDFSAAAYVSDGILSVRPITVVPKAELFKMLSASESKRLMNEAKQVGIAALIYASDYDDYYPSQGNFVDILGPYIRDIDLLKKAAFDFPRGSLSEIDDPSQQTIGYIQGQFGRAVMYADGSVRWLGEGAGN